MEKNNIYGLVLIRKYGDCNEHPNYIIIEEGSISTLERDMIIGASLDSLRLKDEKVARIFLQGKKQLK